MRSRISHSNLEEEEEGEEAEEEEYKAEEESDEEGPAAMRTARTVPGYDIIPSEMDTIS